MGALKDEFSFTVVSLIAGLTAVFLFAAMVIGMPICSGFNPEEGDGEKDGEKYKEGEQKPETELAKENPVA